MSSKTIIINSKGQFDALLKSSRIVVADFYADWCGPCQQISPLYESLSQSLSQTNLVTFVKINNDEQTELAQQYRVSGLPTFLIFRDGKVIEKVRGANPSELKSVVQRLATEVESLGSGSGAWIGAELPKGYSDITEEVEIRNCELLNADEDAGPVKVLFDSAKPSTLADSSSSKKDWVQSGADDQLLLFIPFQSTIKLHTLQITSLPPTDDEDAPSRPSEIHLYINRPQNMDFSEADDTDATQIITLTEKDWNKEGTANIPLRFVKFQKTTTLIVYVQKGDGEAETVRLDRLKLIGDAGAKRDMGPLQKVGDED